MLSPEDAVDEPPNPNTAKEEGSREATREERRQERYEREERRLLAFLETLDGFVTLSPDSDIMFTAQRVLVRLVGVDDAAFPTDTNQVSPSGMVIV
jgi:hypothetical protein